MLPSYCKLDRSEVVTHTRQPPPANASTHPLRWGPVQLPYYTHLPHPTCYEAQGLGPTPSCLIPLMGSLSPSLDEFHFSSCPDCKLQHACSFLLRTNIEIYPNSLVDPSFHCQL